MAHGTKLQQLSTGSNESFERTLQIARDFNQKLDILAQRIKALRKEECHDDQQMDINKRLEMALSERDSKPEELPKSLAARPHPSKLAYNAPDANTTLVKIETTSNAAENNTHRPNEGINYNYVGRATTSEKEKRHELCKECRQEYITGHQCQDSSLHALQSHMEVVRVEELPSTNEGGKLEQDCHGYLQMEINGRPEIILTGSTSQPKKLLKLLAAQAHLPKAVYTLTALRIKRMLAQSTDMIKIGREVKKVAVERCKSVNNKSLVEDIEGLCRQIHEKPVEDNQARSDDLSVHKLIQISRLAEACIVCGFVNGYKELNCVLERPHPCSLTLPYEQAKLQESNGEVGVTLHTEEKFKALALVIPKWMQTVQDRGEGDHLPTKLHATRIRQICKETDQFIYWLGVERYIQQLAQDYDSYLRVKKETKPKQSYKWGSIAEEWFGANPHTSTQMKFFLTVFGYFPLIYVSIPLENTRTGSTSSWCKQKEQYKYNLKEQLITTQPGKEYCTNKRSERVFEGREQIYPELLPYKHPIKALRRNQNITINHYGPYHISEQTGSATRKLRLFEGPKGKPSPQQVPPSLLLTGEDGRLSEAWRSEETERL